MRPPHLKQFAPLALGKGLVSLAFKETLRVVKILELQQGQAKLLDSDGVWAAQMESPDFSNKTDVDSIMAVSQYQETLCDDARVCLKYLSFW
jgi:hypothetical protein